MYDVIREIVMDYALLICMAIIFGIAIAAIISKNTKRENSELREENIKLKARNECLERFAQIAKEEKDKEYVRGYYDSIGVYDI